VPQFGLKKDAYPGFVNEMWFRAEEPGVYRGQCAELCGYDHGFMPVVVEVKTKEEFEAWLQAQQQANGAAESEVAAVDSQTENAAVATVARAE